jgi:hypothetical protein
MRKITCDDIEENYALQKEWRGWIIAIKIWRCQGIKREGPQLQENSTPRRMLLR